MIRIFLGLLVSLFLVASASAQSGYQIKSGDTLSIEVLEDPTLNRTVLVLPDGTFTFPLVGTIQAGGRSVDSVRALLVSGLAPNFATGPTVFVAISSLAPPPPPPAPVPVGPITPPVMPTIDVFIMGEVTAPGKVQASPGTTILQLLAQAGGLTQFAAPKRIELRRTDKATGRVTTYLFNYLRRGRPGIRGSTQLIPGDVVVVPQRRLFE